MKKLFSGYILTGGKSSRMGTDKAFLQIGGKTFIEKAVETLITNCELVKIVLNKSQTHFIEKLPAEIPHIFDIYANRGAPGGIHAALQDCETEFTIISAVDLPFITGTAIGKLCEIAITSKKIAAFVPRQNDGKLQPLCAIYRTKKCLLRLNEMLQANESVSMRDFLDAIETRIIKAEILGNENLLVNVNSPQDFVKHENLLV